MRQSVPAPTSDQKLTFSFEYYDTSRNDYCLSDWPKEKIKETLSRLKDINTKSFNELRKQGRVYHFDEVLWDRTIHPSGFPDNRAKNLQAFHFSLIGVNGQLARVYGAFSSGVFYIIWFDFKHKIWPTPLRNT